MALGAGVLAMMGFAARLKRKLERLGAFEKTMKGLVRESGLECAVGYPVDASGLGTPEAAYDGNASVIQVAIWNNYGTDTMPSRPFMDLAAQNMRKTYKDMMQALGPKLMKGEAKLEKVLDVIGLKAEEDVRKAIMDGDWAPDSPATIALKKSSRPLVDTGTMMNRVTHSVRQARG